MVTVGGCAYGGVVITKVLANGEARAVGKDDVVFCKAFFDS